MVNKKTKLYYLLFKKYLYNNLNTYYMSNPINLSDLGTLIINEKNLLTRSQFDVLTYKYNQFINTVFLDTFGNLVSWVKPTNIASITTQSSLPNNYIFIKGTSTRQRITFTSSSQLHNNVVSKMISSIQIIVNGITSNLDLTTSGIVIDRLNKTIDFNYTASSLLQHDIIVKLKNINLVEIGSTISTNYTISVQSSEIIELEFPNIVTTIKNSPHDIADVTVGQTLSMTSTFSDNIHSDIVSTVIVYDGTTNINALTNISGSSLNYSFTVSNDSDHSGIITLSYGNLENIYSWSSTGLLTAANDIYTFPNTISYDGSINDYEAGFHLKTNTSNTLVFTVGGGDGLNSSQVLSIVYIIGTDGTLTTVSSSNIIIDFSTGEITVSNIIPESNDDDLHVTITLKGPDNAVQSLPLISTISKSEIISIKLPNTNVSRYIFMNGSSHPSSWSDHLMANHIRYHTGVPIWDIGPAANDKGVIVGRNSGGTQAYPTWLIWREKTIAKSFSKLYYWQNSSSSWYMAAICKLWGINSISTDAMPSEASGWTLIGYFRIGAVNENLTPGNYVAAQFNSSFQMINDGTNAIPLSTDPFGIWGITPEYLYDTNGHGTFISRISVNESTATSLNDPETTVLSGTLSYS